MIENLKIGVLNTTHYTNCYLIYSDNKKAVLIDPADNIELIEERINELNLNLKYVLLTHAHADHILALQDIISKYNVKVIANINEKDMIEGKVDNCSKIFGIEKQHYNLDDFIFLDDEEILPFESLKIRMVHTPGHTKGSVCYYIEDENILITGDTLFSNSFGRDDLETGNSDELINSLIKLYKNYSNTTIYPGHGEFNIKLKDTYDIVKRLLKYTMRVDLNDMLN